MQMDQNQHTDVHHPISFVSINKCKVIYEDQSGHVEKNFSNSAQARLFVQQLTTNKHSTLKTTFNHNKRNSYTLNTKITYHSFSQK